MEGINNIIFSVSEYIELLNIGLKKSRAKIIGEVTEIKKGPTGHVYFSMKDEKDGSVMSCIIWKSNYIMYGIDLKEGVKIIATGCPNIYALSGRLSFVVDVMEFAGEGELKKEYEKLKKKLAEEGLFDEAKKRPIPRYPQKIGLITSRQGAVMADFLNNIGKFGFKVKMIDSRVEGQEAVSDLLASIKTFKKQDIEVLVIIRGGGSLESMMAFNNELVVREVAKFFVPVIVAVGHHKDEPLIDFVADISVSTPSIAATTLNESWEQALLLIERCERDVFDRYGDILEGYKMAENKLKVSLQNFKNSLVNAKIDLHNYFNKVLLGFRALLLRARQKLEYAEKSVNFNSPEHQLNLGYSIAAVEGRIIRSVRDVKIGKKIEVRVADGTIDSEIKKINKQK